MYWVDPYSNHVVSFRLSVVSLFRRWYICGCSVMSALCILPLACMWKFECW